MFDTLCEKAWTVVTLECVVAKEVESPLNMRRKRAECILATAPSPNSPFLEASMTKGPIRSRKSLSQFAAPLITPTKQLRVWGIQDLFKSCSIDESNRGLVDHSQRAWRYAFPLISVPQLLKPQHLSKLADAIVKYLLKP
ncbi:hypothetical protein CEXT_229301 [Caerostris extrusa]|uniref:Uncharacterized protein n=1 Tax=Caerostris extrusa TaxID=172846 RepID=A0AAV4NR03_CAEEX|nr:hypothetical protein CEXT_229301 [Caerostris extrusa]